uniref:putative alkyl/aryl-sulfatase YjcS n=1 Tax=Styela clava TaxID=7725 RepID=UPI00193AC262|nr:putative alkyl/aryl-sulfatase YjcS [Styela clava]
MENVHWLNFFLTAVLMAAIAYQGMRIIEHETNDAAEFQYLKSPLTSESDMTEATRDLIVHSRKEFLNPEVIKVTDNVHVAVGFAIANSVMIEGDDGLIIVDTTESGEIMQNIMEEFRKISTKPVKAVVFTHHHPDHVSGIVAVLEEGNKIYPNQKIDLYAHESTSGFMAAGGGLQDIGFKRAFRQFGALVKRDRLAHAGNGIGLELKFSKKLYHFEQPLPTITFKDKATFNVAGIKFEMIHTPGETDDTSAVWLPEKGVLLPGDNIYKSFPHLYAIRGSPVRDCKQWYESIDVVRELKARFLIPGHTRPLVGTEEIFNTLTIYRDAIKYVHDQTVRYTNKGYLPEDIIGKVILPDNLAQHPYLEERYGTVKSSAKGVYNQYLGWFNGEPVDLEPLHSKDRATRLVNLLSTKGSNGIGVLVREAQKSLEESRQNFVEKGNHISGDDQWALELAEIALKLNPDIKLESAAKTIKISALRALGVEHGCPNVRNYYFTTASEIAMNMTPQRPQAARAFEWSSSPIETVHQMFCYKIKGFECQNANYTVHLNLTDLSSEIEITTRNGVCDINDDVSGSPSVALTLDTHTWRLFLGGEKNLESEIVAGTVKLNAGTMDVFEKFMNCFDAMV